MKSLVHDVRTKAGISQKDLAESCDVSRQTMHAIESGKYEPSTKLALKIAKFFGMKVEELFVLEKGD